MNVSDQDGIENKSSTNIKQSNQGTPVRNSKRRRIEAKRFSGFFCEPLVKKSLKNLTAKESTEETKHKKDTCNVTLPDKNQSATTNKLQKVLQNCGTAKNGKSSHKPKSCVYMSVVKQSVPPLRAQKGFHVSSVNKNSPSKVGSKIATKPHKGCKKGLKKIIFQDAKLTHTNSNNVNDHQRRENGLKTGTKDLSKSCKNVLEKKSSPKQTESLSLCESPFSDVGTIFNLHDICEFTDGHKIRGTVKRKQSRSTKCASKPHLIDVKNPKSLLIKDPLLFEDSNAHSMQKRVPIISPPKMASTKIKETQLDPGHTVKLKSSKSLCNLFNTIWTANAKADVVHCNTESQIEVSHTETVTSNMTKALKSESGNQAVSAVNTEAKHSDKVPFPSYVPLIVDNNKKASAKALKIQPKIPKCKTKHLSKKPKISNKMSTKVLSQNFHSNHCAKCFYLSEIQYLCSERSKRHKIVLVLYRTKFEGELYKLLKRKYFPRKVRVRQKKPAATVKIQHTADADDEESDEPLEASSPTYLISGPLKHISLPDLWMQKPSYLRYLCNFYKLEPEGELAVLVCRLHWYVLHLNSSTDVARPYYLRYTKRPHKDTPTNSWVQKILSSKQNDVVE